MQKDNKIMIFYTRQSQNILDSFSPEGTFIVKEDYVRQKYTTITDHYAYLYRLLTLWGRKYIEIPPEALYPIWMSPDGTDILHATEGTVLLKLDIPEGNYLIVNNEVWDHMINHIYFPLDKEDELRHEEELARYGISAASSLISGNQANFYPLLRQKIMKSWEKVYTTRPQDPNNIAGLCWQIKKEWLR